MLAAIYRSITRDVLEISCETVYKACTAFERNPLGLSEPYIRPFLQIVGTLAYTVRQRINVGFSVHLRPAMSRIRITNVEGYYKVTT